jgi:hypothetical protein
VQGQNTGLTAAMRPNAISAVCPSRAGAEPEAAWAVIDGDTGSVSRNAVLDNVSALIEAVDRTACCSPLSRTVRDGRDLRSTCILGEGTAAVLRVLAYLLFRSPTDWV